ncbi:MAG: RecQ family ATP-dependent DNA helicase [Caldilineaceae bacterium]|nr:RecQ family ATP-dependent DNA helicase [Caldilineaceae bacterium]
MTETEQSSSSLLTTLHLTEEQATALPPEIRDQLLDFLELWGQPAEVLHLLALYRRAHGPLLHFLDREAQMHLAMGDYAKTIETIEQRQRRSTTIESQATEARALLRAGHSEAAQAVAEDISTAYATRLIAILAAAEVFAGNGDLARACALLEKLLADRPGNLGITLMLARLALTNGDKAQAQQLILQMGAGITPDIDIHQLRDLQQIHEVLGNAQSAEAAALELERQRMIQREALQAAMQPIIGLVESGGALDRIYGALSGPERVTVSRQEEREVKLAAIRNFGFTNLRPGQIEIIASVLRGESVLAVMPTGAGKSLCYQLPGLVMPKATLVISPLIALMKDQVEGLPAAAQAKATFVNSTLSDAEMQERLEGVAQGKYKLIYAAPERLRQRPFLRALRDAGLSLFVVDEAHCVSLWGHDFRPDYLFIQEARDELDNPPALAMTATAPPRVRDEILDNLSSTAALHVQDKKEGEGRPQVVSLDIFRHNLHLSALKFHNDEEKLAALLKFVRKNEGSGIVYANSRRKCEALALTLRQEGISAEAYHAGLADRGAVQDRFMSSKTRVVVATVAFGMGIDKSDIRFIVHFHPPRSLAAYYQEAGRAGRDNKPAQCVLFYSGNDWANLRRWAKADEYNVDDLERVYAAVATQLGVSLAAEDGATEPTWAEGTVNAHRLEQVLNTDETETRVAVSFLERAGLLTRSFDLPKEIEIGLQGKESQIRKAREADPELDRLLRRLALRPGGKATFGTETIANGMNWPLLETEQRLLHWQSAGILTVRGSKREMSIHLPARPANLRERLERLTSHSGTLAQRRIDDIVGYATAESCRHGFISAHFGSPPRTRCDVCDNCTGIRPEIPQFEHPDHELPDDADIEPMILDALISSPKPVGRGGLARILTGSLRAPVAANECRHHGRLYALGEGMVIEFVDEMIAQKLLRQYERNGYPVLAPTLKGRTVAETWLAEHPDLVDPTGATPEKMETEETPVEAEKYTGLQKALYSWRRRTADEQGVPAYVIMDNDLMFRIAESHPQTMDELRLLPGMGAQRLERHGPVILDLVKLNPESEGDEALLTGQREEKATLAAHPVEKKAPPPPVRTVSPQAERRIYMKMQELRQKVAVRERGKPYLVAGNNLLKSIAQTAPGNEDELFQIVGFRSSGLRDEVAQILQIIAEQMDKE